MNITKTVTSHTIDSSKVNKGDMVAFRPSSLHESKAPLHGVITSVSSSHIAVHCDDNQTTYRLQIGDLIEGKSSVEEVWQTLQMTDMELRMTLSALEGQILRMDEMIQWNLDHGDSVGEKLARNHGITTQLFEDLHLMVHGK